MKSGSEGMDMEGKMRPEKEVERSDLFRRIRSKFMAMAMAGLITFGSAKESLANQIRFEKNAGSSAEAVLEPAITEEKLREFEEQLRIEEPEFIEWLQRYERGLSEELDSVADKILNYNLEEDKKNEIQINKLKKVSNISTEQVFSRDHKVIDFFQSHPDELITYQRIIKDNLHNILLGASLVDGSKSVRQKLSLSTQNPRMILNYHHGTELMGKSGFTTIGSAEIHMTPGVFLGPDSNVSIAGYINFMIHEILHSLQNSGNGPELGDVSRSDLYGILIEGITQNVTYEVIQFLQIQNEELKSVVGYRPYDQRIVVAAVLDAISKSHGTEDSLARWASVMIDDDQLIKELKEASSYLGLDSGIASDLANFRMGVDYPLSNARNRRSLKVDDGLKLTIDILARLKNSGLTLPPEFIQNVFVQDRVLDSKQSKNVENLTEDWPEYVKYRAKKLR